VACWRKKAYDWLATTYETLDVDNKIGLI
jgi:hypothetical protein